MVSFTRIRYAAVAASILVVTTDGVRAFEKPGEPATAPLRDIKVSFKLDPRLNGPTYGGELWFSRPTFTSAAQAGTVGTVDMRVQGVDARGRVVDVVPEWIVADPAIVSVTPGEKSRVRITVNGPVESKVTVAAQGVSRGLLISGKKVGRAMQVEIRQEASPETRPPRPADRGSALLAEAERAAALLAARGELQGNREQARKQAAEKNRKDGEAFLAANRAREGVVTRPSGLQYKVLKAGDGDKPTVVDTVVCHYRGTLVDGREFDSSHRRQRAATLAVRRAIPGWSEALQLMPVGSKWQIVVPARLAFGRKGVRGMIGPDATLLYDVELLSIKDTAVAIQGQPAPQDVASELALIRPR